MRDEPEVGGQDRTTTAFHDEFALGSSNPLDYRYDVPFHRILSGGSGNYCTVGPGVADTNIICGRSTPFVERGASVKL